MDDFRADMHCHTTCSDGSEEPAKVIAMAAEKGLKGLSITDHDTIDAYPAALTLAEQANILLVPGVEFSAVHKNVSVHILAYSFSVNSPIIQDFCTNHQQRRENRMKEMLKLLSAHKMPITEEELFAGRKDKRGIGRPHLANVMIKKGYVKDINEAFKRFLGDGRPCYTSGKPNTVEETLQCIKEANGYAVIAHPHLIAQPYILKDLLNMPFDGMEGHYARFSQEQNQRWIDIAEKKEWLTLGGSDYHGSIKPNIPLGCSWIPKETFDILYSRYLSNK